jgi:RNase P subunit RPR2
MPVSDYSSQLTFLKDSAHSLASQSPSTAAHLLAVHNQILHHQFKPLNQRQKDAFCGACGSIRSPQSTESIQIHKKGASGSSSKNNTSGGATVYKCRRCGRRTVNPLRREPIRSNIPNSTAQTSSAPAVQSSASTTDAPAPPTLPQPGPQAAEQSKPGKTAENAGSKKRAKTRKQGGLQALLASKQQSQPSLDLFDFLQ